MHVNYSIAGLWSERFCEFHRLHRVAFKKKKTFLGEVLEDSDVTYTQYTLLHLHIYINICIRSCFAAAMPGCTVVNNSVSIQSHLQRFYSVLLNSLKSLCGCVLHAVCIQLK